MEQAKQGVLKIAQDMQSAKEIITQAQCAANTIAEAAELLMKKAKLEANDCVKIAEVKANRRISAAEHEAKKCLDAAEDKAKEIVQEVQKKIDAMNVEQQNWEEDKEHIASTHNFESTIKLDIGGHSFTTTLTTLTRFPKTMLGAMFSGRHALTKNEAGAYFIDRDGRNFHCILNFLRSPESFDKSCVQGSTLIETD